jgi:hypothetical protein
VDFEWYISFSYRFQRQKEFVFLLLGLHSINLLNEVRIGFVKVWVRHEHRRSIPAGRNVQHTRRRSETWREARCLRKHGPIIYGPLATAVFVRRNAMNADLLFKIEGHAATHVWREQRQRRLFGQLLRVKLSSRTVYCPTLVLEELGLVLEVPVAHRTRIADIVRARVHVEPTGQIGRVVAHIEESNPVEWRHITLGQHGHRLDHRDQIIFVAFEEQFTGGACYMNLMRVRC